MLLKPFVPSHPKITFPMSYHLTVTFLLFSQDEGKKCYTYHLTVMFLLFSQDEGKKLLCAYLLTNKQRNFINNGERFCLKSRKCWYKPCDGPWSQSQKAAYLLITVSIESTTAEERTHFSSSWRVFFRVLWNQGNILTTIWRGRDPGHLAVLGGLRVPPFLHQVWQLFPDWSSSPLCWRTHIQLFRTQLSPANSISCPINVGFRTLGVLTFRRGGRDSCVVQDSLHTVSLETGSWHLRLLPCIGSSLELDYRTWWASLQTLGCHTLTAGRNFFPRLPDTKTIHHISDQPL